jgi:copper chaperone NosL
MKKSIKIGIVFSVFGFLFASCQPKQAEQNSQKALQVPDKESNIAESKGSCRNCGMASLDFPQWNVKLLNKKSEGQSSYFCSPRCLFVQATADNSPVLQTDSILVVDYYDQKFIDARKAFFVLGADVTGPMGNDFVPFAEEKAAKDFFVEHKGKKIVKFADINNETILNLLK